MNKDTFDKMYQDFLVRSITENRKMEKQIKKKLTNFDQIYKSNTYEFSEERNLNIRMFKIPTFIKDNRINYYAGYLVDIDWYRLGEMKNIHTQCREIIDNDVESYTIFLAGKLFGHIDPMTNKNLKWYNTYVLNTTDLNNKHLYRVYDNIERFLITRCNNMDSGGLIFGHIADDVKRLREFTNYLHDVKELRCDKQRIRVLTNIS